MILIFGPLATVEPSDVSSRAGPLVIAFVFGVLGIGLFSALVGKAPRLQRPHVGGHRAYRALWLPGTMILSQEAARGAGESPEEVAAIEHEILPKMIVAGSPR